MDVVTEPVPPSKDPWYTLPQDASLATPGAILRLRTNPPLAAAVGAALAYQILYSTTDAVHNPSWAVTTVFLPQQANGKALLSHQIPYNTANVDKSPSWIYYEYKNPALTGALSEGWWVNVPDHEGPKAAFGAEVGQGYATLDSIRAVLKSDLGLSKDPKICLWGFSGGALASGFAAELQVKYAPELDLAGLALGGPAADIRTAMFAASKSHYAGLVALALLGTTKVYPEARAAVIEQLKPETKERFLAAEEMGLEHALEVFEGDDMWNYFYDGERILELPAIKAALDPNWSLGQHGVPQMPVFVYHAIKDEVALIGPVDKLVDKYCEGGAHVLYQRNTHPDHGGQSHACRPAALAWLRSAFAGRLSKDYPTEKKVIETVTIVEDPDIRAADVLP